MKAEQSSIGGCACYSDTEQAHAIFLAVVFLVFVFVFVRVVLTRSKLMSLLYFLYLYLYLCLRVCVFFGHGASTRHCRCPELHLPPLAFGGDLLFSKFSMFEKEIRAGSHISLVTCFGTYHKQRILPAILVSTKLGLKPVVLLPYLPSYDILKV